MKYVLIVLAFIGCYDLFKYLFLFIKGVYLMKKNRKDEHHCNYCEQSFIYFDEIKYKYCPYCGKRLTLHKDNPNFIEIDDELEDIIEIEIIDISYDESQCVKDIKYKINN